MKVAVVGSRSLNIEIPSWCIPENTKTIISGGASGIDHCAREYAYKNHIFMLEVLPDYRHHGRAAPLKRNDAIIDYADMVLVFWDGKSRGSGYVIRQCRKTGKAVRVFQVNRKTGDIREITEEV